MLIVRAAFYEFVKKPRHLLFMEGGNTAFLNIKTTNSGFFLTLEFFQSIYYRLRIRNLRRKFQEIVDTRFNLFNLAFDSGNNIVLPQLLFGLLDSGIRQHINRFGRNKFDRFLKDNVLN